MRPIKHRFGTDNLRNLSNVIHLANKVTSPADALPINAKKGIWSGGRGLLVLCSLLPWIQSQLNDNITVFYLRILIILWKWVAVCPAHEPFWCPSDSKCLEEGVRSLHQKHLKEERLLRYSSGWLVYTLQQEDTWAEVFYNSNQRSYSYQHIRFSRPRLFHNQAVPA